MPATFARLFFAYSNGHYWRLSGNGMAVADAHRGHRSAPRLQGMSQRRGDESGAENLNRIRKLAEASGARFLLLNLPEHLEQPPSEQDFLRATARLPRPNASTPGPALSKLRPALTRKS